jgi:hypothetical protein
MKIGKSLLGKLIEVTWIDPVTFDRESHLPKWGDLPHGRKGLARWLTRGRVISVEEDVLQILSSETTDASPLSAVGILIPSDLVESIIVFMPETGGEVVGQIV